MTWRLKIISVKITDRANISVYYALIGNDGVTDAYTYKGILILEPKDIDEKIIKENDLDKKKGFIKDFVKEICQAKINAYNAIEQVKDLEGTEVII